MKNILQFILEYWYIIASIIFLFIVLSLDLFIDKKSKTKHTSTKENYNKENVEEVDISTLKPVDTDNANTNKNTSNKDIKK